MIDEMVFSLLILIFLNDIPVLHSYNYPISSNINYADECRDSIHVQYLTL